MKQLFFKNLHFTEKEMVQGVRCPCCLQFVKLYRRQIHSKMAYDLIALYKLSQFHGDSFYHYTRFILGHIGDFNKLAYWDFIAAQSLNLGESNKRASGRWMITGLGKDFVEERAMARQYAHVFNGKVLHFSGEMISIQNCLGKKFNYERLMRDEK